MSAPRRVQQQPAFILHHRPFRDSSQILDILTRDHGKIALVARGSRGAKSRLRGVLRPFLPLRISWVARSDLGTLTGAEAAGLPADLRGDVMLSAYYVNELLINFLHRHDPQAEIFGLYADTLEALGTHEGIASVLRSFEIELLGLHTSQKKWLDTSQGHDSYLNTLRELDAQCGRMSGKFEFAEGWRRHLHLGFCSPNEDPIRDALSACISISKDK